MVLSLLIAIVLLTLTTFLHITATILVRRLSHKAEFHSGQKILKHPFTWLSIVVLVLFFATFLEVLCWALTYLLIGAIEGLEPALYFSMVTYTTVGYGDIILGSDWRLLSAIEAVNGLFMFGWSSAVVVIAVQHLYGGKKLN